MRVRWKAKQLRLNRAAKLGRDVTQDEVAKATGLAISRLSDIENNKAEGVRFDTLTRLAKFYGVERIGELLEFESAEENSNPILVAC